MSKLKSPLLDDEMDPKVRRRIFIGVTIAILLAGLAFRFWREWEVIRSEFNQLPSQKVTVDCGVVLTGSAGRVREGFDLLEQGQIQKLIISGVHPQNTLRDLIPLWPYYHKVQEDSVILEKRSETTYGNAVQSLPLVQALKCRDILLITSELHMYRSYSTFRPVYPESIYIYKNPVIMARGHFSIFDEWLEVLKSLFYRPWAY